MQFTLSLNELSPIMSSPALFCTGITHTAALGVGSAGEKMRRTLGCLGSASMVCLLFITPGAAEKKCSTK